MKRLSNTFIPALLLCLLPMVLAAQDTPPILDCTEPDGVDAKLVATTQRASAKHLGEKPTLEIIDTHVHFYDPTRPQGIPWPGKNNKQLYRPVLPDEFKRLSKPFGVAGTIVVEASPWIEDNQWWLDPQSFQRPDRRPLRTSRSPKSPQHCRHPHWPAAPRRPF